MDEAADYAWNWPEMSGCAVNDIQSTELNRCSLPFIGRRMVAPTSSMRVNRSSSTSTAERAAAGHTLAIDVLVRPGCEMYHVHSRLERCARLQEEGEQVVESQSDVWLPERAMHVDEHGGADERLAESTLIETKSKTQHMHLYPP